MKRPVIKTMVRKAGWRKDLRYRVEYGYPPSDSGNWLKGHGVLLTDKIDPALLVEDVCRVLGVPCQIRRIVTAKKP